MHFLTQEELRRLLRGAQRASARDHCMVLIGYRHGLRASEICALQIADVDTASARMVCGRLKGSVSNWQQLGSDEVDALQAWLKKRPKAANGDLFVDEHGNRLSRFQFYRLFRRHARAAGIPAKKCHPHTLKHALGTHLANAGVPVQVIQQRLGHRCIQNTMVYLAISSRYVDQAVESAIQAGDVV